MTTQSTPGFVTGQMPSAAQWNGYFAAKLDAANAGTMAGQNSNAISVTGGAIDGTVIGSTTPSTLNGIVIATGSTTGRTLAARFSDIANILDYNAVPSLTIDQAPYIQAAINEAASAGQGRVFAPAGQFRCASGITIPNGVELVGVACTPASGATTGTILVFDATVSVCVTMGAVSNNDTCSLKDIYIARAGGQPASTTVGVKVLDGLQCVIDNVFIANHGIGLWLRADSPYGLGFASDRLFMGQIVDAYVVQDGWSEARFERFRFGTDGPADYSCNAFVRITGGSTSNASAGPNTLVLMNGQFNQGNASATVGALLQYSNQLAGSISDLGNTVIEGCHAEGFNYTIQSDATWTNIKRVRLANSSLYDNIDTFSLNAATTFTESTIIGCLILHLNLPATAAPSSVRIADNEVATGPSSVALSGTATIEVRGNQFASGFSVTGTLTGGAAVFSGNVVTGSTFACSVVSAYLDIDQPGWAGTWTPALTFAGGATGMTYASQSGTYHIHNGYVDAWFDVELSALGSSTGVAQISLPLPSLMTTHANGIGTMSEMSGMQSMPGPAYPVAQGSVALMNYQNSNGTAQIANGNFTNTSIVRGNLRYRAL